MSDILRAYPTPLIIKCNALVDHYLENTSIIIL